MKKINTVFSSLIALSLLCSCSNGVPGATNADGSTNTNTSNTNNSSTQVTLNEDAKIAFASMYQNEGIFNDSEVIATQQTGFNTKGLIGDIINSSLGIVKDVVNGVFTIVDKVVPDISISANLSSSLGRGNFDIKISNVFNTTNTDGSTTKALGINFISKTDSVTSKNKVAKTYLSNGNSKIEQYLTVDLNSYGKVATRVETMQSSQSFVENKSTSKLANGTIIEITESRNSNNAAQGSGNIIIKSASGATNNYSFTSNVDASGNL
ncbi:hypothetical protein EON78_02635, partial [bacterium]